MIVSPDYLLIDPIAIDLSSGMVLPLNVLDSVAIAFSLLFSVELDMWHSPGDWIDLFAGPLFSRRTFNHQEVLI